MTVKWVLAQAHWFKLAKSEVRWDPFPPPPNGCEMNEIRGEVTPHPTLPCTMELGMTGKFLAVVCWTYFDTRLRISFFMDHVAGSALVYTAIFSSSQRFDSILRVQKVNL